MVSNSQPPEAFQVMPWHLGLGFPYRGARFVTLKHPVPGIEALSSVTFCVEEWGNPASHDVVVIFHALTGDSHVAHHEPGGGEPAGWWEGLIGPGAPFNPERQRILCANTVGGCMGSTGPGTLDPQGRFWGSRFPFLSLEQMVDAEVALLDALDIRDPVTLVGPSMGGMKALAMVARYPERVRRAVVIGAPLAHSPWAIAFHAVGRAAIFQDPDFAGGDYYTAGRFPQQGLAVARMADMISYRSPESFAKKFGRERQPDSTDLFQIESYLRYQGQKLLGRFDVNTYLRLTWAMDAFDLLQSDPVWPVNSPPVLMMSISSDVLYPPPEIESAVRELRDRGLTVAYAVLEGPWGHDTFLVDQSRTAGLIHSFLKEFPA